MEQYDKVDQRILDTIDLVREEFGSCTAGQVARRMRMSKNVVVYRCGEMRKRGLVTWNRAAGSLRRVVTDLERPRELKILTAVFAEAASTEANLTHDELVIRAWCLNVIAEADGVGPAPAPSTGGDDSEQQGGTSTPDAGVSSDEYVCCGRTFSNKHAWGGHLASRAHKEAQAASLSS